MHGGIECVTPSADIYMYVVYMYTCVYTRQCLGRGRVSEREHEGDTTLLYFTPYFTTYFTLL
jgi:hypothetical protein